MMGPRELGRRIRAIFGSRPFEDDLSAEIEVHLEMATEDYIAQGMSPRDARRAALLDFGGVEQAKELHRETRGLPFLEQLGNDVRLAFRGLRRDSKLAVFAISIVALGIAASTLVFSVTQALLIRPLPFNDPERLVWVANGTSSNLSSQTIQVDNVLDLREASQTFSEMEAFNPFYGAGDIHVDGTQGPQRITGVPITEGFLSILGVEPIIGRGFTHQEVIERERVVLLSYGLWRGRYNGDEEVVGQTIRLNGEATTIIGVLPRAFDFPRLFSPGRDADVFLPFAMDARNNRRGNTLAVIGRLNPEAEVGLAQAELKQLGEVINAKEIERRNGVHPRVIPLHERISGDSRSSLFLLNGAVAVLMLIVCANLSNLLLARATTRRKEMALHTALGASRMRLIRKLLCESLLLSGLGTALGVLLAVVGVEWLSQLKDAGIPLLHQVQVDVWVVLFAAGLATLAGVLFGVFPALQASSTAPAEAMRSESRTTGSPAAARARQLLVVSEIALACVLLVGVGLFLRSLLAALSTDLGFETENVVALRVDLPRGTLKPEQRIARYDQLLAAVRATPQVVSAGLTDALPLGDNFGWRTWSSRAAEWTEDQDGVSPLVRIVDGGYWETLGLRVLAGRALQDSDIAPLDMQAEADRVVVINETLAKMLWPEAENANQVLSRRLVNGGDEYRVVGVVSEARYFNLEKASGPEMYFSIRQIPYINSIDLVMRTEGDPASALAGIRQALTAVAPELPMTSFRTMDGLVDRATFRRRAVLGILAGFGGFGFLLAVLGVYSVIAYTAAQNRRELGVRLAFGATRDRVCRELVQRTMKPLALGALAGLVGALWLAKAVASQLYVVSPNDPLTLTTATVLLVASGMAAAYIPARRAAGLEITEALRED